jgi:hypothetical protein
LFKKRIYSIYLGTFVGKRKQTILKKRWFDITSTQYSVGLFSLELIFLEAVVADPRKFQRGSLSRILGLDPDKGIFKNYLLLCRLPRRRNLQPPQHIFRFLTFCGHICPPGSESGSS